MTHRALMSIVIEPASQADRERLDRGLATLLAEDPTLQAGIDRTTSGVVLGGTSELHLEIALDRLRREFGVEARVGPPEIVYRVRLRRPADGEKKYAKQTAHAGQYAHVKIHVSPAEPDSGYVFRNEIVGGAIPRRFIPSVDAGIQEALAHGVLDLYPVEDVRIALYDGSYHDVDSSEMAFKIAGALACQEAVKKAEPILIEPVMRVRVEVLEEHLDDVSANLASRRGQLLEQETHRGMQVLTALVPLVEMFGYPSDLRERTRGRGAFEMHLAHYQPCPPGGEDGDRDAYVGAPRKRPPTLRDLRIALPEPDPEKGASES